MALHRNGNEVILGTDKGEVHIWDTRNSKVRTVATEINGGPIHSLAFNLECTSLAAVNSAGQLITWSLPCSVASELHGKQVTKVHSSYGLKVRFSPDSTLLATCGADGKFCLLKTADYSVTLSQDGTKNSGRLAWVWDCAFSADSRFLITATSDGIARLWNLETGDNLVEYKGHRSAITCLAFRD
ncbi:unnamed protein product, partial [Protopolystoma xenopodis]